MAGTNWGINSECCDTGTNFADIYGCLPTGLAPGNLYQEPTTNLWETMFGGGPDGTGATNSTWDQTASQWINPYNTIEQNPRNCIDFKQRCGRNDRISLALPGDCCASVCASVVETMDLLKRPPQVQTKTVNVLGPTKMGAGSVSPPITLQDLWRFTIRICPDLDLADHILYQVSKNGNSWRTLPMAFVNGTGANNIYDFLFDTTSTGCADSCLCLSNTNPPSSNNAVDHPFPDTNAFWGTNATNGEARVSCAPRFCYFRIVATSCVCIDSFQATYANGGGLCSSLPTCPNAMIYEDKICRPLPARSFPGLPAPEITGWGTADPDQPVASNMDATRNRQLYTIAKQARKQHPGGASESQHTRNVRALAGPPWNSRATNNTGSPASDDACGMCTKVFDCGCGVGCDAAGNPLPNGVGCSNPAFCRRRYARKHQSDGRMLDDIVGCAVAGCRMVAGSMPCAVMKEVAA